MEETTDRPKWLVELENRKRKPRLAHEAGAGSPCMVCNSACPGLDLHFWRKICKNCKCSRDDHDVNDDDFPQFDLLFGSTGKFKKKSMVLRVNNKKQNEAEAAFEWVPPDTTKELATDYMKALPEDKLPIKGSAGAALRRQLLQKQLPLHDIDHNACDELTESEQKQFEKYLENLKQYVGQGKVTKMLAARPFNRIFMTPANATDMRQLSPQHKAQSPASLIHLRTPSSFNPKINVKLNKQDFQGNTADTHEPEKYDCTLNNISTSGEVARSELLNHDFHASTQPANLKLQNKCTQHYPNSSNYSTQAQADMQKPFSANYDRFRALQQSDMARSAECTCISSMESSPLTKKNLSESSAQYPNNNGKQELSHAIKEQILVKGNNVQPYSELIQRPRHVASSEEIIRQDGMLAEAILAEALLPPSAIHSSDIIGSTLDKKELSYIREKLANKYSTQENAIVPGTHGLSRPLNNIKSRRDELDPEREADSTNTALTKNSGVLCESAGIESVRMEQQLPSTIAQSSSVNTVLPGNMKEKDRITKLNDSLLPGARSPLKNSTDKENKALSSPIRSENLPAELIKSGYPEGRLYTTGNVESHVVHSESLKNPIFPHEATIIGQTMQNSPDIDALKEDMEGLTMNSTKVQKCHKCQEEIRVGDVVVTAEKAKNESWHPGCFTCSVCNELLVDLIYFYYKNKLYCGRDLAALLGIPRCFACDELIFVQEYTVAEGHNYHVKHFCCWDCDIPLAGKQYVSENDRPLCLPCYQKTYAKTCNACNVVIAADQRGVAVKHLNFHADETCFCCHSCKKNLLNGRMAIKEDKLFCSRECITKFLNRSSST